MNTVHVSLYGIKKDPADQIKISDGFEWQASYSISSSRAAGDRHELSLDDQHYLEFEFDDNTSWFGNRDSLSELFPEIDLKKRGQEEIQIPFQLHSDHPKRSLQSIALKVLHVFAKKAIQQGVHELAEKIEKHLLENQSGLYQITPEFELIPCQIQNQQKPFLLFLHGTGSSVKGSFAELKGTEAWTTLCTRYAGRILGFQHETLTKSPLQNVSELLSQLPDQATLHVVSHSRGGLVGEVLHRFSSTNEGIGEESKDLLKRNERSTDLEWISQLENKSREKKIQVEKFIRVACPARGTSLLSRRLDFYFNVSLNLLSLATTGPLQLVGNAIKELIAAILESKSDVSVLPGLEAMSPGSPFLKILNNAEIQNGAVYVIAGNATLSINLRGLMVILGNLVFKGDNDFVVNTASMYQGSIRKQGLRFYYDEGKEVSHFNYFKNSDTRNAMLGVLCDTPSVLQQFKAYQSLLPSETERGVFGLEGGNIMYDKVSGRKPVVIMLAGIMGSSLGKNGNGIWLNYLKLVMGGLTDLAIDEKGIEARGLIKTSYKKLAEHLSRSFDVVTFPYDWRISVTKSAALLNERMVALLKLNQPIKIIAHSMGGVLAREFILNHPSTWNQLNNSNEFILLLLGTPWMGSYRIPNVLCGRDGIIKSLDTLDFAHSKDELVNLFSKFPGILNLLPTRKEDHDFSQESTWIELQKASGLKWTIPPKSTIAEFGEFRKRVQENESKIDYTHIRYIAGKDDITQMNYRIENGQIQFEATARGDQSVTWDSGIPAKLKNTESVYYSQVTHGGLANEEKLFAPIVQLITTGTTTLLPRTEPRVDTQKKRSLVHLEAEDDFEMNETLALQRILGLPVSGLPETEQLPVLKVSVSNGDLMFSRYPVMLGHFRGDGIVSAERVADTYLKGKLSLLHALGTYPGHAGSLHFEFPEQSEFKGVCVIGIGEIDQLNTRLLSESVEKAAIEYTLHERWKRNSEKETLGLSTLLIGADYGGLGIETSLRAILQGIQAANAKIRALKQENIPLIEEIEFIELFEDRALQCFYSLKKIMSTYSLQPEFEFADAQIRNRPGKRKRLLTENKSDWWQRLTVLTQEGTSEGVRTLRFLSSTNGAREERSDLECNFQLVEHLIESLSTSDQWNPESAKTIFELLVPNSFKENIKRQTDLVWILDSYSASFPWELFQTDIEKSVPLCISAGMIRTLATNAFRSNIIPVNNRNMLIIGDPQTDGYCQPLGGAEKEASEVSSLFENEDYQVKTIIHGHSTDIVTAFFQTEYKMIHLSGHGYYDPQQGISGMVIGNKVFLTPREFNQMSYAPELVFVNCCHLGKIQEEAENLYQSRHKFAANIGTQLINNGVKAVIAAGWAVDDAAALEFARVFYHCMLNGYEFGKAVLQARKAIFSQFPTSNTWGAFQCYGDPFYKLKLSPKRMGKEKNYTITEEAENDVDNLFSKAQIAYQEAPSLKAELDQILEAVKRNEVGSPELFEKIARCYVELDEYVLAIDLFRTILKSERATYSVSSLEKFNNILAKQMLDDFLSGKFKKRNFIAEIDEVIGSLKKLLDIANTSERNSLIGSAYKRKARMCKNAEEKKEAITQAAYYYCQAYDRLKDDSPYALLNWLELEIILNINGTHQWGKPTSVEKYSSPTLNWVKQKLVFIKKKLEANTGKQHSEYWDMISLANTSLCSVLLSEKTGPGDFKKLEAAYARPWESLGSLNKKRSELEHFDLLIDFCSLNRKNKKGKFLLELKGRLEQIIESQTTLKPAS